MKDILKTPSSTIAPVASPGEGVETFRSWLTATGVLLILTLSFGAPLVTVVALKDIAADLGSPRSIPALASSLVWLGSGLGAMGYGWLAERIGFRRTAFLGAVGICAGLVLSSMATAGWQLVASHGLLLGVLGSGAINVPMMVYISRWFDRRRGSALAFVMSGQYVAGAIWPSLISLGIERVGWRQTMLWAGLATAIAIFPIALFVLSPAPEKIGATSDDIVPTAESIRGLHPSLVFALLCFAGFLCCVPMAMPSGHLVALCSDLGITASRGALMLSVLLGSAFISRLFWGWLSDRVGGLWTILWASTCQAVALVGFIWTQDEAGLFAVSAAFGLGFSGIIPAYVVALRQLFASNEASWRVPIWFFTNLCGMAFGGWLAGLIYDHQLSYAPAFVAGVIFNVANIAIIGLLAYRQRGKPAGMRRAPNEIRNRRNHVTA